jgi:hypothetical protein
MVAVSSDDGASFATPVDLSVLNSQASIDNAHLTQVTSSGSDVYVTWADSTLSQIYVASSPNNGSSWTVQLIDPGQSTAVSPLIASTGQYVYVVWTLGKTLKSVDFSVSSNYGNSFSAPRNIASYGGTTYGTGQEADLAISGSNVYVIWDSVYFTASSNHGSTWLQPKALGSGGREPLVAAAGNHVYATWTQRPPSSKAYQIYFDNSSNNGTSWSATQIITKGLGKAEEPQVAASGSNVYIMYRDVVNRNGAPNSEGIFFLYNLMNGAAGNWHNSTSVDTTYTCGLEPCNDLSKTINNTSWGKISAGSDAPSSVDLIWTVNCGVSCSSGSSASAWNVVVAASTDGGNTFSMQTVHPDNGQQGPIPKANAPPVFASDNGNSVYVAYQDNSTEYSSNGNAHIIFAESSG